MNGRLKGWIVGVSAIAAVAAGVGMASAADESENVIKYRQNVMRSIGGHTGAIAAVVKGEVSFGAHVAAHAEALAATSQQIVDMFPEGTLTRMPGLLEFHIGAFLVAARTGTPVLPVAIRGTRSVLRGEQWFPRRGRISVHSGKLHLPDGNDFEAALRLRDRVRRSILEFSGEPDLAHEEVSLTQT